MNNDSAKDWGCVGAIDDSLTELLKKGARALIRQAVEEELQAFLSEYTKVTDLRGRKTVVAMATCRNGKC